MEKLFIGVDVGGMSIKAGVVNNNGEIIYRKDTSTNVEGGKEVFLKDIKDLLVSLIKETKEKGIEIIGIGFGIPGVVDNKLGNIDFACNLHMEDVPLAEYLKDLDLPIYLSNDASVACLAEERFGGAKGYTNVVLLTLGTGIGGGVVIDDKLFEGVNGKGTEVGHTTLILDGIKCGCGRLGCFESYASAAALLRQTKEEMLNNLDSKMWEYAEHDINKVSGKTAFECSKVGDLSAIKVVNNYVKYLSEGVLNYCNIFRPEIILLGGGISNQGDYLTSKVTAYCEERDYGYKRTPKVLIEVATLKNDAGIIGAATLAKDNYLESLKK